MSCREDKEIQGKCEPGRWYCAGNTARMCTSATGEYKDVDCSLSSMICSEGVGCTQCIPGGLTCSGPDVAQCTVEGTIGDVVFECNTEEGYTCLGGRCVDACARAEEERSYVGCEYWAVDLDNAVVSSGSAAAQQFAVVVSNPGHATAHVVVERNDAPSGWPEQTSVVDEVDVPAEGLKIIKLPAREVDGSADGQFGTGPGSALTSHAYRIRSTLPIVAYQFNPLENVGVFSNDASILFPRQSLGTRYLILSWPQTIARTDDPNTNMGANLRPFVTVVALSPGTDVWVTPSVDVDAGLGVPDIPAGQRTHFDMGPFDVLNLEANGFMADFTGTVVESDKPVAVFTGTEASDVPLWTTLYDRKCCADHLEHQMIPVSAVGRRYVVARTPPRTPAIRAAGGDCTVQDETDLFRIMALYDGTVVYTTLPDPHDAIRLDSGQWVDIEPECDFELEANQPVLVGQFMRSQGTINVPLNLPGGDPSFIMVPPEEQWRSEYVFLTPDKYAFDFVTITAPAGSEITLDYQPLSRFHCTTHAVGNSCGVTDIEGGGWVVHHCQMSFPVLYPDLPSGEAVEPGIQNDGYHVIQADRPVGLVVSGFDKHVSYGYTGGMDVRIINVQ